MRIKNEQKKNQRGRDFTVEDILDLFIIKIHLSVGGAKPNDVEQTVLIIHPLNNVLCHFILLFIQFAI